MPPTVAVAMGTYNGARFIAEQLASILRQDVLPDEIVLSDDGSTDDTVAIARIALERAEAHGIGVTIISGPTRLGVTANFSRAIAACSSEIVVLSDQDDLWRPTRVADVTAAFSDHPDLVLQHADARLVTAAGEPLGATLFESLGITAIDRRLINEGQAFGVYLRRNLATGATVAFRRALFDVASPLPAEWVHDEWLAIIAAAVGRVEASENIVIDYRQHGSNEIGVAAPTLRYRLRRMLATSPTRNAALAIRARVLIDRLGTLDGVPREFVTAASAKADFEEARAALPSRRLKRIRAIRRIDRQGARLGGNYAQFASQGRLDMLRDLVMAPR